MSAHPSKPRMRGTRPWTARRVAARLTLLAAVPLVFVALLVVWFVDRLDGQDTPKSRTVAAPRPPFRVRAMIWCARRLPWLFSGGQNSQAYARESVHVVITRADAAPPPENAQ